MPDILKEFVSGFFWKLVDSEISSNYIVNAVSKPFENETLSFEDERVNESFRRDNATWNHYEMVLEVKEDVLLEPKYGYAIVRFNKIVSLSAFYPKLRPSVTNYLKQHLMSTGNFRKTTFDKAVLFDGKLGDNYFHFFSDIINKIWLLDKYNIDKQQPLIIGYQAFNTKYFQYLYHHSEIGNYNWRVQQKDEYIHVKHLTVLRPMPYDSALWKKTLCLVDDLRSKKVPHRKVFLTRTSKSGRFIENWDEIAAVLKRSDFELVETGNMPFEEQVKLFSETLHFVAIHGAGETNIMFAQPEYLHFLEINPANRISCQYYWLSKSLGIKYYDCLLGGELPAVGVYPEKGFELDAKKFERTLGK